MPRLKADMAQIRPYKALFAFNRAKKGVWSTLRPTILVVQSLREAGQDR